VRRSCIVEVPALCDTSLRRGEGGRYHAWQHGIVFRRPPHGGSLHPGEPCGGAAHRIERERYALRGDPQLRPRRCRRSGYGGLTARSLACRWLHPVRRRHDASQGNRRSSRRLCRSGASSASRPDRTPRSRHAGRISAERACSRHVAACRDHAGLAALAIRRPAVGRPRSVRHRDHGSHGMRQGDRRDRHRRNAGPRRYRGHRPAGVPRRRARVAAGHAAAARRSRIAGATWSRKSRPRGEPQGERRRRPPRADLSRGPAPGGQPGRDAGAPGPGRQTVLSRACVAYSGRARRSP